MIKLKKNIKLLTVLSAAAVFAAGNIYFAHSEDQSITNLPNQNIIEKKQKQIDQLEQKADAYRNIIEIKQKQQNTLQNQIDIIDAEINETEIEIESNKKKIEELNNQINDLENKIEDKESLIKVQKEYLSELIRSYYESRQRDVITTMIFENSEIVKLLAKEDSLVQIGERVQEMLENVKKLKADLAEEIIKINQDKKDLTNLHSTLEDKSSSLETKKSQKSLLILQTQGEENKYQDLLTRVEEQKKELLGDIDELYGSNSEVSALAATLEKPTVGLANYSWYYSQKDSRWGNNRIGRSDSLIKNYGCALTSVAMIFTFYGETATPAQLANEKIFYWDLISWPDGDDVNLVTNSGHGGISWATIDREVARGNPVIVYIKAGSKGGHYVVIHHKNPDGRYVVHDPYFGANIYLDSSMKLLSALYNVTITKSSIDQMIIYKK
jgi:peptidoglycan hydrolase CwlO-like protein